MGLDKVGNIKHRTLQMRFFTAGTATGAGETLTFFKNIAAEKTLGGAKRQFFTLNRQRPLNMGKVVNCLFFLYPYFLR